MKLTCILCSLLLAALGIFAGVYAFSGFNLLYFLCFSDGAVYRSFLAVCFVAALFEVYALIVFKPFKGLK